MVRTAAAATLIVAAAIAFPVGAAPLAVVRITGPGNNDAAAPGSTAGADYYAEASWFTGSAGGGSGRGSAHIGTGELKAVALQDNAVDTVVGMRTATRFVDDTLTFGGPGSGPWVVTFSVDVDSAYVWTNPLPGPGSTGSVGLETLAFLQLRRIGGGSNRSATARVLHQVFEPGTPAFSHLTTPTEQVQFGLNGASAVVVSDFVQRQADLGYLGTLAVTITVLPGETWQLEQGLEVFAQGINFSGPNASGWFANNDAGHTARLRVSLPAGVTLNSSAGLLTAVPLPPALPLLLAGLAALPHGRRRGPLGRR